MHEQEQRPGDASASGYPTGRGYGHDYMRGGEVFGGYGYADREAYFRRRGDERNATSTPSAASGDPAP